MRAAVMLIMLLLAGAAQAQGFDCNGPRFRGETPQINEVHIFCGEIRGGKDEGYHSELVQPTPNVVAVERVHPVGRQGAYEGIVRFANGGTHRSTFWPKHCRIDQIEASIRFAAAHPFFGQQGDWTYGASAPLEGGTQYCLGTNGRAIEIQFARTGQGGINTAFPDGR